MEAGSAEVPGLNPKLRFTTFRHTAVIVSDSVRQLAAGKGLSFEPMGEVSLKGFDEPEKVWKEAKTRRP